MNPVPLHSVLLIGPPDAGKSNFLFRFWIAVDEGRGVLVKDGLPPDQEHLQNGANQLLKGAYAAHTSQEVHERSLIPVKGGAAIAGQDFRGSLVVPDVAGEQVLSIYRKRQWSQEWEDAISHGCGCLLFVRPDSPRFIAPPDWATCMALWGCPLPPEGLAAAGVASRTTTVPAKENRPSDSPHTPSDAAAPVKTPTQVVLVDWLQFLRKAFTDRVGGAFRPRIGIVISAWDALPNELQAAGPESWVKANLPLLYQFLRANDDQLEATYFGISVSSGDLKNDPEYREAYLEGDPRRAGYVLHQLGSGEVRTSTDMTLPVAWAMGLATGAILRGH